MAVSATSRAKTSTTVARKIPAITPPNQKTSRLRIGRRRVTRTSASPRRMGSVAITNPIYTTLAHTTGTLLRGGVSRSVTGEFALPTAFTRHKSLLLPTRREARNLNGALSRVVPIAIRRDLLIRLLPRKNARPSWAASDKRQRLDDYRTGSRLRAVHPSHGGYAKRSFARR